MILYFFVGFSFLVETISQIFQLANVYTNKMQQSRGQMQQLMDHNHMTNYPHGPNFTLYRSLYLSLHSNKRQHAKNITHWRQNWTHISKPLSFKSSVILLSNQFNWCLTTFTKVMIFFFCYLVIRKKGIPGREKKT